MQGQLRDDGLAPSAVPMKDQTAPPRATRPAPAPEGQTDEPTRMEPAGDAAQAAAEAPAMAPESSERGTTASDGESNETAKDDVAVTTLSQAPEASEPEHRSSATADTQDVKADVHETAEQITPEADATPEHAPSGDDAAPEEQAAAPKKRSSRSRRRNQDDGDVERTEKVSEPKTLVELLVTMAGSKGSDPTKKLVKGAKPTEGIGPDDVTAIRAAVSLDTDFATPVAFLRAVLLSSPSKRAVQQALDIAEQCLIARHLERGASDDRTTPEHVNDDWIVGWLTQILSEATRAPGVRRNPEVDNLTRALVVLLSARGKFPPETVPAILVAVDGRAALETQPAEPSEMRSATDAMGFATLLHRDQLSHQTLIAAAVHIEGARRRTKQAEARAADFARRSEQAEQLSRRLAEETAQTHAAVVEAETARDELRGELASLRQQSQRWHEQNEEIKAALAELEERVAEERERNEQRRIDDSNAYEALRAATSRSRRRDLELLAEAAAALEKEPPKPHVALDRIALVLRSMERERESLRPPDQSLSDPEVVNKQFVEG